MTEFEDQTPSGAPPAVPFPATVSQTVSSNAGSVIGVRTDVIHGNVYGNTVSEVQVLVFGGGGGPELWRQLLDAPTPYPWPRPYGVRDRARFCGRTAETEQVLRQLTEGRVLILYGPAGMGKTSLLCAGVMPRLLEAGALVVRVQDYLRPLSETLRGSLQESHEQLPLELPAGAALPSLVRAVQAQTGGTLVLVLDQFERLFDPEVPAQERAAFADDLGQVLRTAPGMDVRVIVAVREDALGSALGWGNLSSAQNALPLGPLDPQRAGEAVESPLELTVAGRTAFEVVYDADTLNERLLPDLRAMSPDPRGVYPPHLQIVCSELFEEARRRGRPIVDADLYRSVGHAEGVLARYLQRKLNEQFPEERGRQVAWRVLTDLASAEPASWLGLDSFDHGEVPREQIVNTLSRLSEWGC